MPKESIAFAGMSAEQVEAIKKHYKENPGDRGNPEEFIKNKKDNMLGRLGSYLRNQGRAILTEDSDLRPFGRRNRDDKKTTAGGLLDNPQRNGGNDFDNCTQFGFFCTIFLIFSDL